MEVKRTRTQLSNGLPLVVIEVPNSKSAVVSFWTKAGTRLNPEGKEGLAHFLEHMLLKKCKAYPSSAKLAEVLERVGASHNGWTSRDFVHIDIDSASKDIPLTLKVLSEIIFNPLIDRKDTDTEREVIRKEQIRKDSNSDDLVWDVWYKIFFAGTRLEYPNIGTTRSIDKINEHDLIDFWKSTFISKDSTIIVSSGLKTKEVVDLAEKSFGRFEVSSDSKLPHFEYKSQERVNIEKKDLSQVNILLSFRTEDGDKLGNDLYFFVVLRNILSSGWHSRISQRLRVKEGLIYGWGSSQERYLDTGAFTLSIPTAKEKMKEVLTILCEELIKLKEKPVGENELELAKGYIEGTYLQYHETSDDYLSWYGKDELLWPKQTETIEKFISKIKKVTADEVQEVAKKYFRNDNWYLALVGYVDKKDVNIKL